MKMGKQRPMNTAHIGRHRTTTVSVGKIEAEIDVEMAPLVKWLWERGIMTEGSCQGDSEQRSFLLFMTTSGAAAFIRALLDSHLPDNGITARLMRDGDGAFVGDMWDYTAWPQEGADYLVPNSNKTARLTGLAARAVDFRVAVEFPYTDLAHVRAALGLS